MMIQDGKDDSGAGHDTNASRQFVPGTHSSCRLGGTPAPPGLTPPPPAAAAAASPVFGAPQPLVFLPPAAVFAALEGRALATAGGGGRRFRSSSTAS